MDTPAWMRRGTVVLLAVAALATGGPANSRERRPDFGEPGAPSARAADAARTRAAESAAFAHAAATRTPGVTTPSRSPRRGNGLLWEERYDASPFEQTFMAAADRGRVFASGYVWMGPTARRDFVVRAYDGRSGALLWQDQLDRGSDDFASGVVTDGHRLYVSGTHLVPGHDYDWILRCYDAGTGALQWESTFDLAGGTDFSRGTALVVADGTVVLGGYATNESGNWDWIIRAFDARTGALQWMDRRDVAGDSDGVYTLASDGRRLYAGGWGNVPGADRGFARGYDLRSGQLLWETHLDGAPQGGTTWVKKVATAGGRVFAAYAHTEPDGALSPLVQALDGRSGALHWQQAFEPGVAGATITDLDAADGRVVVAGEGGPDCKAYDLGGNCENVIRAYGAASGNVRWERQQALSPLDDGGSLVKIEGDSVFLSTAIARTLVQPGCCILGQWMVQGLGIGDGRLLWRSVSGRSEASVYNLALDRGVLVVPGRAIDQSTGEWDWMLRAYDVRPRKGPLDPLPFYPPALVTGAGTSGQLTFEVNADRPLASQAHGLVAADELAGNVVDDPGDEFWGALGSGVGVTTHVVSVPAGMRLLRVSLFDDATDGNDDLDVYVFDPNGNFAGLSGGFASTEQLDVADPAPGDWTVVIHGYATDGPDANYTLFAWALPSANLGNLTVSGPPAGGGAVDVAWSGLLAGRLYLGIIDFTDADGPAGQTAVRIAP